MIDYKKINTVMCWDAYDGESQEDVFIRCSNRIDDLPSSEIIDIVHAGGLQKWAETLTVKSQTELYHKLLRAIRRTISDPVFQDKRKIVSFPPFANFFYYCQKIDRNDKSSFEAEGIANVVWNGVICRRNIDKNTKEIFANPDPEKFKIAADRIKEVYQFTDKNIESWRYFVCQSRHENHNPSLNKAIYHWGDDKQTGKTTVAKVIVSILNGDTLSNAGTYESNLNIELQYDKHVCPKAALFNAVLLDEAAPKDSRKSYGAVKSKLTNNSCDFDPKYKMVITIPCKRFYYFTSNDCISDFVQDAKERRFLEIHSIHKPIQMSFEDIYQLWFDFCTNATPEENWQEWYNSFDMVDGLATKDLNEIKNEIQLNVNEFFGVNEGTYTTVKKVADKLFKGIPSREQKKSVSEAMKQLFPHCILPSNTAYYTVSMCRAHLFETNQEEPTGEIDEGIPF